MKNIGNIIRQNRKRKNLSLRDLEKLSGIRYDKIGKYERGELNPNIDTIKILGECLEMNFDISEENEIEVLQLFKDYLNSQFYYEDNSSYFQARIENKRDSYMNSFEYSKILLIEFIICVTGENFTQATVIEKALLPYCKQDLQLTALYYQYKALILREQSEIDLSIDYFLKALELNNNEKQRAMICYHLSTSYKENGNLLKAVEACHYAKNVFSKHSSYLREIHSDILLASIYSRNNCYEDAICKYEFVLKSITDFHSPLSLEALTLTNMVWSSIVHQKYEKGLELLDDYEHLFKNSGVAVLYAIWCFYKTSQFDEAANIIRDNQWVNSIEKYKEKFHLFSLLVKAENDFPSDRILNSAIEVYSSYKPHADYQVLIFYLNIILDLLEKMGDERKQNYYLKMKISLLERHG